MSKIKTLIKCIFKYKGRHYNVEDIMPSCLEKETAMFLYKDGNYSDDIYRAALIRIRYGDDEIPNLPKGSKEIELVDINVECN
ncbi:hypothetical protein [Clostridium chromiireducens]|uniref:Uncharacterized protein n=1 Tax=Clostridium chromiireducens TaxID=225345 RepID=A0A1V4IM33_9CLOT|nr:hypothetical protein [Clostridium chromiireducens]MVX66688.1 hypothetical protein [Clostridium chromiireducens]OPJ60547.1 hypothetical protein CLCHR_28940 [Clostridium chromiireducens]RII33547.1 hypothetical protein D2A34_17595 [Clostridium chromiireducens]